MRQVLTNRFYERVMLIAVLWAGAVWVVYIIGAILDFENWAWVVR